jgi:hypothetical protein
LEEICGGVALTVGETEFIFLGCGLFGLVATISIAVGISAMRYSHTWPRVQGVVTWRGYRTIRNDDGGERDVDGAPSISVARTFHGKSYDLAFSNVSPPIQQHDVVFVRLNAWAPLLLNVLEQLGLLRLETPRVAFTVPTILMALLTLMLGGLSVFLLATAFQLL